MREEFLVSMGLTCTMWPCTVLCQIIPEKEKNQRIIFYIQHVLLKLLLTQWLLVQSSIIIKKGNIILTTGSSLQQVLQMPEVLITVESEIINQRVPFILFLLKIKSDNPVNYSVSNAIGKGCISHPCHHSSLLSA